MKYFRLTILLIHPLFSYSQFNDSIDSKSQLNRWSLEISVQNYNNIWKHKEDNRGLWYPDPYRYNPNYSIRDKIKQSKSDSKYNFIFGINYNGFKNPVINGKLFFHTESTPNWGFNYYYIFPDSLSQGQFLYKYESIDAYKISYLSYSINTKIYLNNKNDRIKFFFLFPGINFYFKHAEAIRIYNDLRLYDNYQPQNGGSKYVKTYYAVNKDSVIKKFAFNSVSFLAAIGMEYKPWKRFSISSNIFVTFPSIYQRRNTYAYLKNWRIGLEVGSQYYF